MSRSTRKQRRKQERNHERAGAHAVCADGSEGALYIMHKRNMQDQNLKIAKIIQYKRFDAIHEIVLRGAVQSGNEKERGIGIWNGGERRRIGFMTGLKGIQIGLKLCAGKWLRKTFSKGKPGMKDAEAGC